MKAGQRNVYTCERCKGRIVTVDLVDGTTPFMIRCRATHGCPGFMRSSFYMQGVDEPPTHEWYRPSDRKLKRLSEAMKGHVEQGGLLIRPVTKGGKA